MAKEEMFASKLSYHRPKCFLNQLWSNEKNPIFGTNLLISKFGRFLKC